jgi:hypothetical protein
MVTNPTYNNNILDIFLTNCFDEYNEPDVYNSCVKTDHRAIFVTPKTTIARAQKETRNIYDIRMHNRLRLSTAMSSIDWLLLTHIKDANLLVNTFNAVVTEMKDQYIPVKVVKTADRDPYWCSPLIKSLIKKRNRLLTSCQNEDKLKTLNQKISKLINDNINFIGRKMRDDVKINSREWWRQISNDLGKTKNSHRNDLDVKQMEELNKHFASICTSQVEIDYTSCLQPNTMNSCNTISITQVYSSLRKLKKTATGPDGLDCWLLKDNCKSLAPIITFIYNSCIDQGVWPEQWKLANICAIPKNNPPFLRDRPGRRSRPGLPRTRSRHSLRGWPAPGPSLSCRTVVCW